MTKKKDSKKTQNDCGSGAVETRETRRHGSRCRVVVQTKGRKCRSDAQIYNMGEAINHRIGVGPLKAKWIQYKRLSCGRVSCIDSKKNTQRSTSLEVSSRTN